MKLFENVGVSNAVFENGQVRGVCVRKSTWELAEVGIYGQQGPVKQRIPALHGTSNKTTSPAFI